MKTKSNYKSQFAFSVLDCRHSIAIAYDFIDNTVDRLNSNSKYVFYKWSDQIYERETEIHIFTSSSNALKLYEPNRFIRLIPDSVHEEFDEDWVGQ